MREQYEDDKLMWQLKRSFQILEEQKAPEDRRCIIASEALDLLDAMA